MDDISYEIPEMIERLKRRVAMSAGCFASAAALIALTIAL